MRTTKEICDSLKEWRDHMRTHPISLTLDAAIVELNRLQKSAEQSIEQAAQIAETYDNDSHHGNDTMTKQNIASEIRAAAMPNEKADR